MTKRVRQRVLDRVATLPNVRRHYLSETCFLQTRRNHASNYGDPCQDGERMKQTRPY